MTIRGYGAFGLGGVMATMGGQLGFLRPTFAPPDDGGGEGGGGGYELPEDTPMDAADDDGGDAGGEGDGGQDSQAGNGQDTQPGSGREPLSAEEVSRRYTQSRAALREERQRRQSLERELASFRAGQGGGQGQGQGQGGQGQRRGDPIDPEADPIGAVRQVMERLQEMDARDQQASQSRQAAERQEQQFQAIERAFGEYEEEFEELHPDYDDASAYYLEERAKELLAFGVPQAKLTGMLRTEIAQLVSVAIQGRRNPAEQIYNLAKGRGWSGVRQGSGQGQGQGQGGQGQRGANGQFQAKPKSDALDRIRAGQGASSPLSRGGNRAAGLDPATVANINIRDPKGAEAFDRAWDEMAAGERARERGGR